MIQITYTVNRPIIEKNTWCLYKANSVKQFQINRPTSSAVSPVVEYYYII